MPSSAICTSSVISPHYSRSLLEVCLVLCTSVAVLLSDMCTWWLVNHLLSDYLPSNCVVLVLGLVNCGVDLVMKFVCAAIGSVAVHQVLLCDIDTASDTQRMVNVGAFLCNIGTASDTQRRVNVGAFLCDIGTASDTQRRVNVGAFLCDIGTEEG